MPSELYEDTRLHVHFQTTHLSSMRCLIVLCLIGISQDLWRCNAWICEWLHLANVPETIRNRHWPSRIAVGTNDLRSLVFSKERSPGNVKLRMLVPSRCDSSTMLPPVVQDRAKATRSLALQYWIIRGLFFHKVFGLLSSLASAPSNAQQVLREFGLVLDVYIMQRSAVFDRSGGTHRGLELGESISRSVSLLQVSRHY